MGRPDAAGSVQASATICTTGSALNVGGVPGRGASARTSAMTTARSSRDGSAAVRRAWAAAQRPRQTLTISRCTSNRAAMR
jgi:hypothetical protein